MRFLGWAAVAGCGFACEDTSSTSTTYSPWLENCESTTHVVPPSCGDDYAAPGPYAQVVPVESELVVGLEPTGAWEWLDGGLSIEVDPALQRGPWASLSGGDELLCGIHGDTAVAECFPVGRVYEETFPAHPLGEGRFGVVGVGLYTVCGLAEADGEVRCAGSRQIHPPAAWSGRFSALAHQVDRWVGLRIDGELEAWSPEDGATSAGLPSGPFTAVSGSGSTGCALREDGSLACWGSLAADAPAGPVAGVAVADTFSSELDELACALLDDGSDHCWGPDLTGCDRTDSRGPFVGLALGSRRCGWSADGAVQCLPPYYESYTTGHGCYE